MASRERSPSLPSSFRVKSIHFGPKKIFFKKRRPWWRSRGQPRDRIFTKIFFFLLSIARQKKKGPEQYKTQLLSSNEQLFSAPYSLPLDFFPNQKKSCRITIIHSSCVGLNISWSLIAAAAVAVFVGILWWTFQSAFTQRDNVNSLLTTQLPNGHNIIASFFSTSVGMCVNSGNVSE